MFPSTNLRRGLEAWDSFFENLNKPTLKPLTRTRSSSSLGKKSGADPRSQPAQEAPAAHHGDSRGRPTDTPLTPPPQQAASKAPAARTRTPGGSPSHLAYLARPRSSGSTARSASPTARSQVNYPKNAVTPHTARARAVYEGPPVRVHNNRPRCVAAFHGTVHCLLVPLACGWEVLPCRVAHTEQCPPPGECVTKRRI